VHTHTHTHTHTKIHVHIHRHTASGVCAFACVCEFACVCKLVSNDICMFVRACDSVCVCMYVHNTNMCTLVPSSIYPSLSLARSLACWRSFSRVTLCLFLSQYHSLFLFSPSSSLILPPPSPLPSLPHSIAFSVCRRCIWAPQQEANTAATQHPAHMHKNHTVGRV